MSFCHSALLPRSLPVGRVMNGDGKSRSKSRAVATLRKLNANCIEERDTRGRKPEQSIVRIKSVVDDQAGRGGGLGGGWTTISSIITKAIVVPYKCGNGSYDCVCVCVCCVRVRSRILTD